MPKHSSFRRTAAILSLAVGTLLFSAGGAGAAGVKVPPLDARADSSALTLHLVLPGAETLRGVLMAAGVAVPSLPAEVVKAFPDRDITEIIAMSHGHVSATASDGFAAPLSGNLIAQLPDDAAKALQNALGIANASTSC